MVQIMVLNNENSEEKKSTNFTNQIQKSNVATVCTVAYM